MGNNVNKFEATFSEIKNHLSRSFDKSLKILVKIKEEKDIIKIIKSLWKKITKERKTKYKNIIRNLKLEDKLIHLVEKKN